MGMEIIAETKLKEVDSWGGNTLDVTFGVETNFEETDEDGELNLLIEDSTPVKHHPTMIFLGSDDIMKLRNFLNSKEVSRTLDNYYREEKINERSRRKESLMQKNLEKHGCPPGEKWSEDLRRCH